MIWGIGETVAGVANGVRSKKEQAAMDKRQKNAMAGIQSTNPGRYDLAALFGSEKALNKLAKRGGNDIFSGLRQSIQDYLQPTTLGPGGPSILSSLIGNPSDYLSQFNKSLGFLDQAVSTASEANQTGLLTDAKPAFAEALRQYIKNALPAAAETSGLGAASSGFINSQQSAAEDLFGRAALTQLDLNEAAANRRLQAAPLLQGLTAARQALPIQLSNDLTSLFNFEQRKPIDLFSSLFTLGSNQGPFQAASYSPFNSGTAGTAALLQGLGGLLGSSGGQALGSAIGTGLSGAWDAMFNSNTPSANDMFGGGADSFISSGFGGSNG